MDLIIELQNKDYNTSHYKVPYTYMGGPKPKGDPLFDILWYVLAAASLIMAILIMAMLGGLNIILIPFAIFAVICLSLGIRGTIKAKKKKSRANKTKKKRSRK